jgi:hypothetical protein
VNLSGIGPACSTDASTLALATAELRLVREFALANLFPFAHSTEYFAGDLPRESEFHTQIVKRMHPFQ